MPQTPDEFAAALFVVIVLLALLIVGVGRLVVWVATAAEQRRGVKRSDEPAPAPRADYVAQPARPQSVRPMSALDTDTDTDTDTPPDILPAGAGQGETVYKVTAEQLQKVREDERLAGVARALGTLKGLGLLREVERAQRLTEVKNQLIGTSRAKHKRLNQLIEDAAAAVEPAEERELLEVREGSDARLVER